MKAAALLLAMAVLAAAECSADTLRLKNGESRSGRILAEDPEQILLDPGGSGPVVEIPKDSVAIVDRDTTAETKGGLSFYSTSGRKPRALPAPEKGSGSGKDPSVVVTGTKTMAAAKEKEPAALSIEDVNGLLEEGLEKHPQMKEWLEKAADKAIKNSAQIDELAAAARDQ